jgi:hypothetical protein
MVATSPGVFPLEHDRDVDRNGAVGVDLEAARTRSQSPLP